MPPRRLSDSEPYSEEILPPNLPLRLRRAVVSESSEESSSETESDSETEESESEFERNGFFDDEAEECVFLLFISELLW